MDYSENEQRSMVIPIFLVLLLIGTVASAAGGVYLYLNWEKHFPPMAELQEQLRAARQLTKEDAEAAEAADDQIERSGLGDWFGELEDQSARESEALARQTAEEALRAQGGEHLEQEWPHGNGGARDNVPPPPPLAGNRRPPPAPPQQAASPRVPVTPPRSELPRAPAGKTPVVESVQVLKEGGTIEPMDNDWLPPGVTRSK